jgi:hypothetical protein
LPFQLFEKRPSSCGGKFPALLTAVRYCDITMRRSSSVARRIAAAGEIHDTAMHPEMFPTAGDGVARESRRGHRRQRRALRELH